LASLVISHCSSSGNGAGLYIIGNPIISNSSILYNNSSGLGGGIYISGNSTISNSIISNNYSNDNGGGVSIVGGSPTFNNIIIANNEALPYGGGGGIDNNAANSIFSGLQLYGNKAWDGGGIHIYSSDATITNSIISNNIAYYLGGGAKIRSGLIENSIIINNTSEGDAGGLLISGNASARNLIISNNNASQNGGGVYINGGNSILEGIIIDRNISNNGSALYSRFDGSFTLQKSTITNHNNNAIYIEEDNPIISNNNLLNYNYGLLNANNLNIISSIDNYWGHSSGPYHPSQNPTGQGDSTNAFVNVTPWLTEPNTDAPPIPPQNLTVAGNGNDFISLNWDASLIGDLAGYKLYYDSDSSGYPYANNIDIGNETSYTLSNLLLGTTYYLAVTTYDTDGNESWLYQFLP